MTLSKYSYFTQNIKTNKILLIDSSSNFEKLKNFFDKDTSVITFDYESHINLEQKQISHIISDDFITDSDSSELQNFAHKFSNWYLEKNFSKFLEYNGLNLGRLYKGEFLYVLVKILKKFKEIEIIFKHNQSKQFFAENELFNIIKFFSNHIINIHNSVEKFTSVNDELRLSFKISKYEKNIFLDKKNYLKIKNLLDFFISTFFKTKNSNDSKMKILFSEYDTERFKDLFLTSRKFQTNIFSYSRKRPFFWNFSTFKTIIKSKCNMISSRFLDDEIFKKNKNEGISQMQSKIHNLWKEDSLLASFFTFNEYRIFSLIKPTLIELIDNRLSFTIHEIELVNRMFEKYDFDFSIIINEIGFYQQIISHISKIFDVNCLHMQEGFHWDTFEAIKNLESQGVFHYNSDKLIVWGKIDNNFSINYGNVPSNKIKIIGAPRYDRLFNSKKTNEDYILLASSGDPQPEEINGLRVNKIQEYLDDILQISNIVTQLNENLIIKLHPSSSQLMNLTEFEKINSKISVITSGEIIPLLNSAKLLISVGLSSAMIEALILNKPVIFIPGIDYGWKNPSIISECGCLSLNISELKENLEKILLDKNFYSKQDSQKYISNLLSFQGNASEEFYNFLKNYKKENNNLVTDK
ncbi:MAG: hypothetical protein CL763_00135 [Chloroflexi bacterium]|nr:hypothetical protein [Chloroflexota bacterium]|tara:strand:- start:24187 stop:26097 length:1911 start_codon:yes stop_codon:yes gene_type:complete